MMRTLLLSFLVFSFLALNGEEGDASGKKWINILSIKHIAPKGRIQDKEYNRNMPYVDQILAEEVRDRAIPILASNSNNEEKYEKSPIDYWDDVRIGDMVHIILVDLFTDSKGKRTIPEAAFLLGRELDPGKSAYEQWRALVKEKGRAAIREYWWKVWDNYRGRLIWDKKERCFKKGDFKFLDYYNQKYDDIITYAKEREDAAGYFIRDKEAFQFRILCEDSADKYSAYLMIV